MRAHIYQPAVSPTQSGRRLARLWYLEFEGPPQVPNPPKAGFFGYGTGDPWAQVRLVFRNRAAAEQYARAHGLEADVIVSERPDFSPKSYAQNFQGRMGL